MFVITKMGLPCAEVVRVWHFKAPQLGRLGLPRTRTRTAGPIELATMRQAAHRQQQQHAGAIGADSRAEPPRCVDAMDAGRLA